MSVRNLIKNRANNRKSDGQFDDFVHGFSSQCWVEMIQEDERYWSMRPLPPRKPRIDEDHENAVKDMVDGMKGYNFGSADEFLKKVNSEIDRMHDYMARRRGDVGDRASFEKNHNDKSKNDKNLKDDQNANNTNGSTGDSNIDIAIGRMRQKMIDKKDEMEENEKDENGNYLNNRGYTFEDVQKYNLGLIEDILEIIRASKDLVAASAEFQRLSQKSNRQMKKEVKESKNRGMLDDALEVVRSIGALMMVASDAIDGKMSKEYRE